MFMLLQKVIGDAQTRITIIFTTSKICQVLKIPHDKEVCEEGNICSLIAQSTTFLNHWIQEWEITTTIKDFYGIKHLHDVICRALV
jgi:hypothetical protein